MRIPGAGNTDTPGYLDIAQDLAVADLSITMTIAPAGDACDHILSGMLR